MGLSWAELSDIIYQNALKNKIPERASFELTARCNFHCKMCYVCRYADDEMVQKKELTTEQWIHIAEQAKEMGVLFITLTGGEIFIRKDIRQLYEALFKMGFHITINTNASMISQEVAEWLSCYPPTKVSVTLYGASASTYQKVTGNANGYSLVLNGLNNLLNKGIHVELKTTVTKDNYTEFDEIAKLSESLGLRFGIVSSIEKTREDVDTLPEEQRLNPKELALYEKKFHDYIAKRFPVNQEQTIDDSTMESTKTDYVQDTTETAFKCSAGSHACWFTWEGNMVACGLLDTPSVCVTDKTLIDGWNYIKSACKDVPVSEKCKKCDLKRFCNTCPARLYLETGTFDGDSDYLCEVARCRKEVNKSSVEEVVNDIL